MAFNQRLIVVQIPINAREKRKRKKSRKKRSFAHFVFNFCSFRFCDYIKAPEGYEFTCLLAIGYPAKGAFLPKQKEIRIEDRIHANAW